MEPRNKQLPWMGGSWRSGGGRSEGLRKANTFYSLAREEKKLLIQLMLNVDLCRDASEQNAQARHLPSHLFMAV